MPTPESMIEESKRNRNEGIRSQKDKLLSRGNAMSATPSMSGINQFPNPPIEIGITMKKIMTKACAVTKTL